MSFHGTPVTKALCMLGPLATLSLAAIDSKQLTTYTSPFIHTSLTLSLLTTFLLYTTTRPIERLLSSSKLSTAVIVTTAMTGIWGYLYDAYFPTTPSTPGPFGPTFALLLLYYTYVPSLHLNFFTFMGLQLNEKTMPIILAAQIAFSGGRSTFVPSVLGIISGFTYTTDAFTLYKLTLPPFVTVTVWRTVGWVFDEVGDSGVVTGYGGRGEGRVRTRVGGGGGNAALTPTGLRDGNIGGQVRGGVGGGGGNNTVGTQQTNHATPLTQVYENLPPPPPPPEDTVVMLMGMGFERDRVLEVLKGCDNNVEVAANRLIGGS